jgi:hypothetical protein
VRDPAMLGHVTTIALTLDRVEADRLTVAVDRNAGLTELDGARRLVAFARRGELPAELVHLARRCLRAEGNAPELLARLAASAPKARHHADPAHARRARRRPNAPVYYD